MVVALGIFDKLKEIVVIFILCISYSFKSISVAFTVNSTFNIYIKIHDVFLCLFTIHTFLSDT
jgi:hypothetical protein